MKLWRKNLVLLALMLSASGLAMALRPIHKTADKSPEVRLERIIPSAFGEWREEPQSGAQIVDPQQLATINKIYTETLSRTYVDRDGNRVMLSIAYGKDQSDSSQMHKPEVCYPAQGFALLDMQNEVVFSDGRPIPVTRLVAQQGQRYEPITYWTTVGSHVVQGAVQKKLVEMRYSLVREIPDGLLFRVSSIDQDKSRAFRIQDKFIKDILPAVAASDRERIAGKAK